MELEELGQIDWSEMAGGGALFDLCSEQNLNLAQVRDSSRNALDDIPWTAEPDWVDAFEL